MKIGLISASIVTIVAGLATTACENTSYPLVFASDRSIGIDVHTPAADNPSGRIMIGYKSRQAAIVPTGIITNDRRPFGTKRTFEEKNPGGSKPVDRVLTVLHGCAISTVGVTDPCRPTVVKPDGSVAEMGKAEPTPEITAALNKLNSLLEKIRENKSLGTQSVTPGNLPDNFLKTENAFGKRVDALSTFASFAGGTNAEINKSGAAAGFEVRGEFFATGIAAQQMAAGFEKQLARAPVTSGTIAISAFRSCVETHRETLPDDFSRADLEACRRIAEQSADQPSPKQDDSADPAEPDLEG